MIFRIAGVQFSQAFKKNGVVQRTTPFFLNASTP
jgi:hypothetical protein